MKRVTTILAIMLAVFLLGCERENGSAQDGVRFDTDASYVLGFFTGRDFTQSEIQLDVRAFTSGIRDALAGREMRFTEEEAMEIIYAAFEAVQLARHAEVPEIAEAIEREEAFLAENALRPEVTTTGSGLQYVIVREGTGPRPSANSSVRVHYEGRFTDGTVFDSSIQREEPIEFNLQGVIPGWTEGLQLMNTGSIFYFYIPSRLGYGDGRGFFPPFATLIFNVELIDILD